MRLKAAGAWKGSRVEEIVAPLRQQLDDKIRKKAEAKRKRDEIAIQKAMEGHRGVAVFMNALIHADRENRLVDFGVAAGLVTPGQVKAAHRNAV